MTQDEAVAIAWATLNQHGRSGSVSRIASVRLRTAAEAREMFGENIPPWRDTWYIDFQLPLEPGVLLQSPDTLLVAVDDASEEGTIVYQL